MTADFLLELCSEEIPARMQAKACDDLARLFAAEIARAGLAATGIEAYATPRRIALIARALPLATEPVSEELKGPRADAPAQALAGFLGKTGLTRDQLVERTDAKGNVVLFAVTSRPGRATAEVLAEAIPAIVRAFPWPKSMRWGAASTSTASLRWVRPLKGIVAILGETLVPFEIDGIHSGYETVGHRFHHPGIVTIGGAQDYAEKLRLCHVILDPAERRAIIAAGAASAAAAAGLSVVPDDGLLAENAGLTEWPVPLLGRFDPAFLDVPREVIQLTMRTNQKYFAAVDATGALAPAFLCTANIDAADEGAAIVAGNQKVLAARLSDAKFFWDGDLKIPLEEQAKKLSAIVFHEKLGTVADKVERVAKLARWLVEEGIVGNSSPELAALAYQAAKLCKADLVTGMVGEFPELQGVIGGYLARAQGEEDAVADAIRDHYKPVGQGDDVPTAPVTVAVSLADKLDSVVEFFCIEQKPTGSKDPFALRRSVLGIEQIILANSLRVPLDPVFSTLVLRSWLDDAENRELSYLKERVIYSRAGDCNQLFADAIFEKFYADCPDDDVERLLRNDKAWDVIARATAFGSRVARELLDFFADRLKVQQREAGVRHDLIDAVFALGGEDDLVRLLARVHALQAFVATDDGANLLAGYKRAANILRIEEKKDAPSAPSPLRGEGRVEGPVPAADAASDGTALPLSQPSPRGGEGFQEALFYLPQKEESDLMTALDSAEPAAAAAIDAEDFPAAMSALSALRAPIDAFFEAVTVNDADPARRSARLALLARIRDAVHRVADFSRIEG